MHVSATICSVTGELAGIYCPADVLQSGSGVYIPADSPYAKLSQEQLKAIFPNLLTVSSGSIEQDPSKRICSFHTYEWAVEQEHINAAKTSGNAMLEQVNAFLRKL